MEAPACDRARAVRLNRHEKPVPLDLSHHYSVVTKRRVPSKIKEAYKFFQIPGILNIAGGSSQTAKPERWTPSPNHPSESTASSSSSSSDPAAASHISVPKTLDESDPLKKIDLATALQYGLAQGYPPLLSWVRQFTRENLHPDTPYRDGPEVVLTCGSTDGFSKTLNLFVDQWTEGINDISERPGMLCEPYVYTNVLSQAQPLGVQVVPVKADPSGMAVGGPGGLEDVLANWDTSKGKRPHLMYTVTLGHNPTGIVLSVERKKEIYAVCSKYDVIIVEDEPYWYLQFPSAAAEEAKSRDQPPPPPVTPHKASRSSGYPFLDSLTPSFLAIDVDGRVVRLDTFSKTVAPGCRLGWITSQPALAERFERISEATTQQPSGFVQGLISELVLGGGSASSKQHNQRARSAFARLLTSRDQAAFAGWDTSGWVRWLEGLRGSYERRMARMCRTLDAGSHLLTTSPVVSSSSSSVKGDDENDEWSPLQAISKTRLYSYAWPRGGMFIWLRVHLEAHPLWMVPCPNPRFPPVLGGPLLSAALMVWLTTKPFLVLVATGSMFSADDAIREEEGWAYYRICFAAEAEENVDRAAERFVEGVHKFWAVRDVRVIEKLLGELSATGEVEETGIGEDVTRMGWFMGC
ncbi:pyridoxal phosphate-dependent transferase [Chaetomidium leptoderma]|uniref:Pyridoxal phosphate-dependent transferase n=1 Tax=Chaetomidium leptoderma TaxID=669021 RepID=A0AAN6ZRB0_9PEZI|nr:pyridoxal phosphate-dependent transferase [Chaetomidium leptoderma]